jgi:hypothetical protein
VKTVKTSRQFNGSPISIRAVSHLENRSFPIRIRDILTDNEFRLFEGALSAGDVDCQWHMSVWRNGFWSVVADFHDGGIIAGDFFTLDLLLDKTHSVGASLIGSILDLTDSRRLSVSKSGVDTWIRENWNIFETLGPSVTLQSRIAPVALVLVALIVVAAVVSGTAKTRGGTTNITLSPCQGQFERDSAGGTFCIDIQSSGRIRHI